MWKRKQQQIEFFNSEPSIIDHFPIIESKDLKLKWVKKLREDFQKKAKEGNTNQPGFMHITRCPGIFDLFRYGYIIPLHKDIIIKSNGKEFDAILPSNVREEGHRFDIHLQTQKTPLMNYPPWSTDFIVKIDTGWHVIAPKGIKFLQIPISYPDTFNFTSTIGIFDPSISTQVNFQMFWNVKEKEEVIIPVGTPLGHLIPLSEKKYKMVQRIMNQRDRDWVSKAESSYSSSFCHITMRNKIVDMYKKYWKR